MSLQKEHAAFESVAPYYDLLMDGVPYRFWLKYLHSLWNRHGHEPLTVLDLACGTGTVALMLARDGYIVTGVDISHAMLDVARKKASDASIYIDFEQQDAADLNLPGRKYDSVISFFDSLNNIVIQDRLYECFRSVRSHLEPGGLFVFDLNTAFAFRQGMFDQKSNPKDGPLQYRWTSSFDEESSICTIVMKFNYKADSGPASQFEEIHYQRAYSSKDLIQMLESAGFSSIAIYDAYSLNTAKRRSDRIFVVASDVKG
jgi:ubiquinone/menaquinone biosynthesis C-methylase UbiE